MKQLVLATHNAGKLQEIKTLLPDWSIRAQGEFFDQQADETGLSFIENAIIKARFAAGKTGLAAIADDSGIEVKALQGAPGIYSSRYAGEGASDAQNLNHLLQEMESVADGERQAAYYCAMVYLRHPQDPTPIIGLGRWAGELLRAPQGEGGFGYDPVFYVPQWQCTAAQLSSAQKNSVSHRAQALKSLVSQLQALTDG